MRAASLQHFDGLHPAQNPHSCTMAAVSALKSSLQNPLELQHHKHGVYRTLTHQQQFLIPPLASQWRPIQEAVGMSDEEGVLPRADHPGLLILIPQPGAVTKVANIMAFRFFSLGNASNHFGYLGGPGSWHGTAEFVATSTPGLSPTALDRHHAPKEAPRTPGFPNFYSYYYH